ncbi:MAG TPA: hypothetical protein VL123_09865 [Candidatus Udaeobacter sp.]|nr:hypothetical protein [Candidatus Udaeobacter sp.]
MRNPPRFLAHLLLFTLLAVTGTWLWLRHATAWDLGGRSPVLSYDAAQYAVAARELALRGRFATTFALPIELARHPSPPWPLALVQPGLVISEAALIHLVPEKTRIIEGRSWEIVRPDQLEWVVLVLPFIGYIVIAVGFGLAGSYLIRRLAPGLGTAARAAAGLVLGLAFLLDPEAQHYAVGGFTELPFTLGLCGALAALALGAAPRRPLLFGILLGLTGAFRGTMLWLAPILAIGNAAAADGRRFRTLVVTLIGYALPLLPWWLYKWHAFGNPAWDLSALSVWDGVQGRTWFSLFHLAAPPDLPRGMASITLLGAKTARNLPAVALALATGVHPLLLGALTVWAIAARDAARAVRAAAGTLLALLLVSLLATAVSVPQLRYLFPVRVLVDAAGLLALWDLIRRTGALTVPLRRALTALATLLVLGWGVHLTVVGEAEARDTSKERGTPATLTLLQIASIMNREIPAGEPVMSNLGPVLAWESRRPVIHLALSPDELDACRRRVDFRRVLLVFRDPAHAWPEWSGVIARPTDALHHAEWNVKHVREYRTADGFRLIWLDLGPLGPELATTGSR